jgi:Raf kinase inhibitor-like YbhB/YbcL family protein
MRSRNVEAWRIALCAIAAPRPEIYPLARTSGGGTRLLCRLRAAVLGAALLAAAALLATACGGTGSGPAGPGARTSGTQATATGTPPSPATTPASPAAISVRSPAFAEATAIPARFSCRGGNTPPPLTWTGIPSGAASIAVVMDDPDAVGGTYTHWVVFNVPAAAGGITGHLPAGSAQARNSGGQAAYLGPCPPSGIHHYRFTVYAEPSRLPLPAGAPLAQALRAIKADALSSGTLTGSFSG